MPNLNKRGLAPVGAASRRAALPPAASGAGVQVNPHGGGGRSSSRGRIPSGGGLPRGGAAGGRPQALSSGYGLTRQHASDPKLASRAHQQRQQAAAGAGGYSALDQQQQRQAAAYSARNEVSSIIGIVLLVFLPC